MTKSSGRPPLADDTTSMTLRVSGEQRERWRRAADAADAASLSKWMRDVLDRAAGQR